MLETICASLIGLSLNTLANSSPLSGQLQTSSSHELPILLESEEQNLYLELAKGKPNESIYRREADNYDEYDNDYSDRNNSDVEREIQERERMRERDDDSYEEDGWTGERNTYDRRDRYNTDEERSIEELQQRQEELQRQIDALERQKEQLQQREEDIQN